MLYRRLALFSMRHAMAIIVIWCTLAGAFGVFAVRLPSALKDHGLRTNGSSARVQQMLAASFHRPDEPVVLLFEKQEPVPQSRFHAYIRQTLDGLEETVLPLIGKGWRWTVPPTPCSPSASVVRIGDRCSRKFAGSCRPIPGSRSA